MTCEWRPILDFEWRYEISSAGLVKRTAYHVPVGSPKAKSGIAVRYYPEFILKPEHTPTGLRISLINEQYRACNRRVDFLVLSSFYGIQNQCVPHHLDGDVFNNDISNLEWKPREYKDTNPLLEGKACRFKKHLTQDEVVKAFMDMRDNAVVAAELGISALAVELIKQRIIWTHFTRGLKREKRFKQYSFPYHALFPNESEETH